MPLSPAVTLGPYAVIEDEVVVGPGCEIGAHAVIKRYTSLGARNRVFEHAVLGGEPQDLKFKDEPSRLEIGDDNLIREFCTLHRACGEGEVTRIGSRNSFMVGVYEILFRSVLPLTEAVEEMARISDENVAHLVSFIRGSKRGFPRPDLNDVKAN